MKSVKNLKTRLSQITVVLTFFFLLSAKAWAAETEIGWTLGGIFGLIAATAFMVRIHPILGIITLLAGIQNIVRMFF